MKIDAISTAGTTRKPMKGSIIYLLREVVRVHGIVPGRRKIGGDVLSVCSHRNRIGEVYLLPTRCSFVGKRSASQECPGRGPDMRSVGTYICTCFIETQSSDVAGGVRLELHSEFGRSGIAVIDHHRLS